MTPHYVRPDHHPLPRGHRFDGVGHEPQTPQPRPSTAPPGLYAPAPPINPAKAVKAAPRKRAPKPSATGREPAPCGTDAAYRRHIKNGDPKCLPCRDAHNRTNARYDRHGRANSTHVREHCGTEQGLAEHSRRKERMCDKCRAIYSGRAAA